MNKKHILIYLSMLLFSILQANSFVNIQNVAMQKMREYGGLRAYGFDYKPGVKIMHEIVGAYDIPQMDRAMKLVIGASAPSRDHECHACGAKMSYFVFERGQDGWRLSRSYINANKSGQWGRASSRDEYQVIKLSDDEFGLYEKGGGTGQGWYSECACLYSFGDVAKEILRAELHLDNGGTGSDIETNWNAKFRFRRGANRYYDVVLHKKGIDKGKMVDEKILYTYNGKKYIKQLGVRSHNRAESQAHSADSTSPKSEKNIRRKRFISVPLRNGYKAVVTVGRDSFKFALSGNGDELFLSFDAHRFDADHIYGVSSECRRSGYKLTKCVEVINGTENAHGTLRYKYDGGHFDVIVDFGDYHPAFKDRFYNDDRYIYWENYKNGKLVRREKYKISKVHNL